MSIYYATQNGMMKGYWKIINERGETIESGFTSARAAKEIAHLMTIKRYMPSISGQHTNT